MAGEYKEVGGGQMSNEMKGSHLSNVANLNMEMHECLGSLDMKTTRKRIGSELRKKSDRENDKVKEGKKEPT